MILNDNLSELKDSDGSALRFKVEARVSQYAVLLSKIITSTSTYEVLGEKLQSPRLLLYFQYIIRKEIYPYVRQACIIEWHQKNKPDFFKNSVIAVPKFGICSLLKLYWDFKDISLETSFKKDFYGFVKTQIKILRKHLKYFKRKKKLNLSFPHLGPMIACQYNEGLDLKKRNDWNWYNENQIDAKNILIYFDEIFFADQKIKPCNKEIVDQIEAQGFQWVALKDKGIKGQSFRVWSVGPLSKRELIKKNKSHHLIEKWVIDAANFLLEQVHYWKTFHRQFNVCIHYVQEENSLDNIVKAIAFDVDKGSEGVLLSKQRSEIYVPFFYWLGHFSKHVFFIWNSRVLDYTKLGADQMDSFIVTGYPYDLSRRSSNFSQMLRQKGANFIITLFDNVYEGKHNHFSKKNMVQFYTAFLEYVIDNPESGLIIKSKKPHVFNGLKPLLYPLLDRAFKTGRCFRVSDEKGVYSAEASWGADMAVGIGISTSVIEAVIGGCRGIHYDVTRLKNHEFYKWGYEKIIFDDLGRLIDAIKKFKEDPKNNSFLGDWTMWKDQLDAYGDGKGWQRMGTYIKWLLEGFEKDKKRDAAIQYANTLFMNMWGRDKVHSIIR